VNIAPYPLLGGGGLVKPPLVDRDPLVFPVPINYLTTLPWDLPLTRNVLRANSWAITIPGAPIVPGGSSVAPERILSWFLNRYPLDFQRNYLKLTASYGYTHVKQSLGDMMGPIDNGPDSPPGSALSIQQVIDVLGSIHQVGSAQDGKRLSVSLMLGSKYFYPRDMSVQQYQDTFGPLMDQMFAAGVIGQDDELLPGWEWNLWNVPGDITVGIFKWVGQQAHANGATCWYHGSPGNTWWGTDGTSRYAFWDELGFDVDGVNYQTDPHWDIAMMQARIVDTLHQFGEQGNVHKFRLDEDLASLQFDGPADQAEGNTRGYCACCTVDNVSHTDAKVWGYGNGGSMPDGTVL